MTHTPYGFLPPPASQRSNVLERLLATFVGWLGWAVLMALGLVFVVSLLFWLLVMVVYSLVSGWISGRPATVTVLWQRYRAMARQHWPRRPAGQPASSTPRADAAQATGASMESGVQDVGWREVRDPASPPQRPE
ncbi:MAG: hypothetical protein R3E52_04485 [Burkholderiaceae bacterium]